MTYQPTKAEEGYLSLLKDTKNGPHDFMKKARNKAGKAFATNGLPSRRVEDYKYTDLRARISDVFALAPKGSVYNEASLKNELGALYELDALRIVFLDGHLNKKHSQLNDLPKGLLIHTVQKAAEKDSKWFAPFTQLKPDQMGSVQALNLALMQGGLAIRVKKDAVIQKPIHLIFASTGDQESSQINRHMVSIGKRAKATIFESHIVLGRAAIQKNNSINVHVANKADFTHIKLNKEHDQTLHLSNIDAVLGKNVSYKLVQLVLDGGLSRNEIKVRFTGEDTKFQFAASSILKGRSHADTTMVMTHEAPNCESREMFKTVLDDGSRAVFQGKVVVEPKAQKTDGEMMSRALLLSDEAEFDSKPELEIYADDVLCGHGATSGQIDEELLYYLQARGISEESARGLLIQAFIGEVLEEIENETIRDAFIGFATTWHKET